MKITGVGGVHGFRGMLIELDANETAVAITDYLASRGLVISGPRTVRMFPEPGAATSRTEVLIDPSASLVWKNRS